MDLGRIVCDFANKVHNGIRAPNNEIKFFEANKWKEITVFYSLYEIHFPPKVSRMLYVSSLCECYT